MRIGITNGGNGARPGLHGRWRDLLRGDAESTDDAGWHALPGTVCHRKRKLRFAPNRLFDGTLFPEGCANPEGYANLEKRAVLRNRYSTVPYTWPQARPPMAEFSCVQRRLRE